MTSLPDSVKRSTIDTLSYEEVLSKLESAKQEFKEFEKGQRKALYQSMQRAAEAASLVTANEIIESRYRKKMGEKDVLYAALIFIFDAQSTDKKKEASKRASALWYLIVKQGISVEGIAKAIPEHGGIEKLARLAAISREDEAAEDEDSEDEHQPKDDPEEANESRDDEDEEDQHRDEPDEKNKPGSRFGKQITVGLPPKLTKKLGRFADQTRIKIIGYVRVSPDEAPTIEVKKIIELVAKKKGARPKTKRTDKKRDDDAGDWE